MPKANKMNRLISKFNQLPKPVSKRMITIAFTRLVKFTATAGIEFEELTTHGATVVLRNRKKVQNHIGGVHACGMALLAETATGAVVGMSVPDDKIIVIKSMEIKFVKRAKGDLIATATLTSQQINDLMHTEKGEVPVAVTVKDEEGQEPIIAEMIWAWLPKKR